MQYFTGKGYGVSKYVDVTGVPLLTYTFPATGNTITLFDRVAVTVDPTIKAVIDLAQIDGGRMDLPTSSALKTAVGGSAGQELDHIISLELGGSNQICNLSIDNTPQTNGNNVTDTYENQLAAAVQSGAMSLVDAWRAICKSKGKVIAEDLVVQQNNSFAAAAEGVFGTIKSFVGASQLGNINQNLLAQIKQDADDLKATPYNLALREKIFTEQINLTSEQLNLSPADAASYMKVYTAKYAQAKGIDPQEVLGALTANEQKIIGISATTPNLLGIPNTVWANVAAGATVIAGIAATIGVVALLISIFTGGAADVAAAVGGAGITGFLTALGVSTSATVAVGAFTAVAFFEGIALTIPMITKQLLDASVIAPSLISTSLNDDIKNIKALGGGSTSTKAPASAPNTVSSSGGSVSGVSVHTSVITGGTLGNSPQYTPTETDIIENETDLQSAMEQNLANYVAGVPGKLVYELRLVGSILLADGTMRIGTTQRVQKGTTKKGIAEFKNVTNKFAVADIFHMSLTGKRIKIDEIVLGNVDETSYQPSKEDLASISDSVGGSLVSNTLAGVTQINLPLAPVASDASVGSIVAPTTPVPVVVSPAPTADQLANRLNPIPVTVTYTYNGLFRGVGDNGDWLYQADSTGRAVGYPLATLQTDVSGNNYSQRIANLLSKYGVDWNSLPQENIGDYVSKFGGYPPSAPWSQLASTAVASTQTDVINGTPNAIAPTVSKTAPTAVSTATTLSEYYTALGQTMPTIAVRAQTYQNLGLGTASLYVGSVEQNTKLLAALKGSS